MEWSVKLFSWKPKIEFSYLKLFTSLLWYVEYYQMRDVQMVGIFRGSRPSTWSSAGVSGVQIWEENQSENWQGIISSRRQCNSDSSEVCCLPVSPCPEWKSFYHLDSEPVRQPCSPLEESWEGLCVISQGAPPPSPLIRGTELLPF